MIISDLFQEIYPYMQFEDYEDFRQLNRKCYDMVLNHNVIYQYYDGAITETEFKNYEIIYCVAEIYRRAYQGGHVFIDYLFDKVYKELYFKHMQKHKTNEIINYVSMNPNYIDFYIFIASNDYEAIYKYLINKKIFLQKIITSCGFLHTSTEHGLTPDWDIIFNRIHFDHFHIYDEMNVEGWNSSPNNCFVNKLNRAKIIE
jgi:SAM-dependent MidA family methyltransferase